MLRVASLVVGATAIVTAVTAFALWPRDDVPGDPDVVVVLGGAGQDRADLGIELSRRYGAQFVLSSSAALFGERRGLTCGVDAMCIDPVPETTVGEARTVADLAAYHGWTHVTVATSRHHTTRARTLFRQCLGNHVTVVGSRPRSDQRVTLGQYFREAAATIHAATIGRAC